MSLLPLSLPASQALTAYFWHGETIRSRSVSSVVLTSTVNVPALPLRMSADCERDIAGHLALAPGDVEALSLARACTRWPDFKIFVQAASGWTCDLGLQDLLPLSDIALMACRGARYHQDAEQYGGTAFCNLFLSEDKGLDLHFPHTGHRIALARGTVVIFDTGQPHAVIQRGGNGFDVGDFAPGRDCTSLFLTWELPIENAQIAQALGVDFDTDLATALRLTEEQVHLKGVRVGVCPETGNWRQ